MLSSCNWQSASTVMAASRSCSRRSSRGRRGAYLRRGRSVTQAILRHRCIYAWLIATVALEHFDPFLAAAVTDSAGVYTDPSGRLDRTLAYFLTVAVADGRTAVSV